MRSQAKGSWTFHWRTYRRNTLPSCVATRRLTCFRARSTPCPTTASVVHPSGRWPCSGSNLEVNSATTRPSGKAVTSFTSAGEAISLRRARRRPWPFAKPIILVPLPPLVFAIRHSLSWPEQNFVYQTLLQIQPPPASLRSCARVTKQVFHDSRFQTVLEAPVRWFGMASIAAAIPSKVRLCVESIRRRQALCVLHGRPPPSSRPGSLFKMAATNFQCLSVNSIHNQLSINHNGTSVRNQLVMR